MAYSTVALGRVDAPVKGVLCVVAGICVFSIQDVIIKSISGAYPVHEIVFVRSLVALAPLLVIAHLDGGLARLRTRRPWVHLLRGGAMLASYTTYYLAIAALPLALAVALFFVAPLMITALSHIVLGEKAHLRRWLAVAVGFAGVVIMTRPGDGAIEPAALFAILAALFYAASVILTRRLGTTENGPSLAFSATLVYLVANALLGLTVGDGALAHSTHPSLEFLLRAWAWPSGLDLALMAFCGLIAGFGFYFLSQAYRLAPAASIAPFEYVGLPLAALWGYLFWNQVPTATTVIGVVLIVGSGLYVLRRESVRGRRVAAGRGLRPRV
jgi:S-adenosylmethionine uptake transporter